MSPAVVPPFYFPVSFSVCQTEHKAHKWERDRLEEGRKSLSRNPSLQLISGFKSQYYFVVGK